MKKLIQKIHAWLVRDYLEKYIGVYEISNSTTAHEFAFSRFPEQLQAQIKRDLVHRLAESMFDKGVIRFEEVRLAQSLTHRISASIKVMK